MILFDLMCTANHVFEAWFHDAATFERQCAASQIACPVCGETHIAKAPMAPRVVTRRSGEVAQLSDGDAALARELYEELARLYEHIENSCDYVGDRFPEEARKIHYGESERRSILGEASEDETRDLLDEGVAVFRLPWARRRHDS